MYGIRGGFRRSRVRLILVRYHPTEANPHREVEVDRQKVPSHRILPRVKVSRPNAITKDRHLEVGVGVDRRKVQKNEITLIREVRIRKKVGARHERDRTLLKQRSNLHPIK